ncbi:hypothetical protein Pcinc_038352, partial [Petrolisthes cinctipes]
KADVHSSDDTVSTSSSSSSTHDHHYEDIDPALMMAQEAAGGGRHSKDTAGGRHSKDTAGGRHSKKSATSSSRRHGGRSHQKDNKDDGSEEQEAARRNKSLQGLDDLIAGVPPPDYDDLTPTTTTTPLDDASARPDVGTSGVHSDVTPPPPEFDDANVGESPSHRRQVGPSLSVPPAPCPGSGTPPRNALSRSHSQPPPPPPLPSPTTKTLPRCEDGEGVISSPASSKPSSPLSNHSTSLRQEEGEEEEQEEGVSTPEMNKTRRLDDGTLAGHRKVDRPMSLPLDVAEHYGQMMASRSGDRNVATLSHHQDLATSALPPRSQAPKTLPFIPPRFPAQPSDSGLIKPSEYLRSLGEGNGSNSNGSTVNGMGSCVGTGGCGGNGRSASSNINTRQINSTQQQHLSPPPPPPPPPPEASTDITDSNSSNGITTNAPVPPPPPPSQHSLPAIPESTEEEQQLQQQQDKNNTHSPGSTPPPPPPPPQTNHHATLTSTRSNTLGHPNKTHNNNNSTNTLNGNKTGLPSISVTDLQSVQLRRTEVKTVKPTSIRIPSLSPEPSINAVKNDVIAELKMGVDISGIKRLKSERAKEEEITSKIEKEELSKQFSVNNFVEQVPEMDNAGNRIPDWKRQMLARKAAERAKREAEETRQLEAEEKRLQSIPPWKRQLMLRRDEDPKREGPVTRSVQPLRLVRTNSKH